MRVVLDQTLCCGFGNCAETCAEVFELDDTVNRARVIRAEPPARLGAAVLRAVSECPTAAITVRDGEAA